MANVPFIYVSVNVWRTLHPQTSVVPTLPVEMGGPLWFCVVAFLLLFLALLRCAPSSSGSGGGSTTSTWPRTKRDAILSSVLCLPCLLLAAPVSAVAQPQPSPDEFIPISEVPPEEQIPAITLIAAAYGFVWVAVVGYVWSLGRRLQAAEREIAGLEREGLTGRWRSARRRPRTSSTSRSCC